MLPWCFAILENTCKSTCSRSWQAPHLWGLWTRMCAPCTDTDKKSQGESDIKHEKGSMYGCNRYHNSIQLLSYKWTCKVHVCSLKRTLKVGLFWPNRRCKIVNSALKPFFLWVWLESIELPQSQAQQHSLRLTQPLLSLPQTTIVSVCACMCIVIALCTSVWKVSASVYISIWVYVCMHDGIPSCLVEGRS